MVKNVNTLDDRRLPSYICQYVAADIVTVTVSVLPLRPYVISIVKVLRWVILLMNYGYQCIAADMATVHVLSRRV